MSIDKSELLKCIDFFQKIKVSEFDVTTDQDRENHQKVVEVDYTFEGATYRTCKLYYKDILHQSSVKDAQSIVNYFGHEVYWLDLDHHDWPHGKGAEIEHTVIETMLVHGESNSELEDLLKAIANNQKTGFLQKITDEGRSQQYGFNLENNNHWHELIRLIQFIIVNKGKEPPNELFARLVFRWQNEERVSLSLGFGNRAIISRLVENLKSIQNSIPDMEIVNVLKQKGQIILQGPPGTGKTFTAKDVAEQIIFSKVSDDKKLQKNLLESTEQFKLIQFHPAYSYEDFVRGIVAESKDTGIEYKTKNKLLADFATKALLNYNDSRKNIKQLTEENWVRDKFLEFTDFITDEIEKNDGRLFLEGTTTYLKQVEEDCFRYTGDNWNTPLGNRMHFKDLLEMYNQNVKERQNIKKMEGVSGLAKQHASYFMKVLDLFYRFMKDKVKPSSEVNQIIEKKFILIIDEINRANLPAVLGELIYALEYRGEKVESMYPIDDDYTLIIPPNLFIIGTMNTSDRSVGHIDYAIRRRFAFIDVLPKVLEDGNFELDLFKQVSALFIQNFDEYVIDNTVELKISEHLSEEFRPEDVWLGHSYFIKNGGDFAFRKKYEIVPILKEYVKDGILKQSAEPIINTL